MRYFTDPRITSCPIITHPPDSLCCWLKKEKKVLEYPLENEKIMSANKKPFKCWVFDKSPTFMGMAEWLTDWNRIG